MHFPGHLKKDGKFWMVEVPDLEVATQGRNRKEALAMIADAIRLLVDHKGFRVKVAPTSGESFLLSANDPKLLMSLFLKRQRASRHLTVREVAKALHLNSHASYSQYESGKSMPGIELMDKFMSVIKPGAALCLTLNSRT